jgi:hypothetical protein
MTKITSVPSVPLQIHTLLKVLGVFTKPDLIPGSLGKWLGRIQQGQGCGSFVVRSLSPEEIEEGKDPVEVEQEFFARDPWNKQPKHRLGSKALADALSTELRKRIAERFFAACYFITLVYCR